MNLVSRVTEFLTWKPLATGTTAPLLSLTADEGTWVRTPDFKDHIHVLLLFFRSIHDDATDAWLKEFQQRREQFEELECAIFGVSTYRTDKLRDYRNSLGLEFYMLYDPFGIDARAFHASHRSRPFMRNQTVLISKDGTIAASERGFSNPQELLETVARLEGKPVPGAPETSETVAAASGFSAVRNPGQRPDEVRHVESEDAVKLLEEKDSPYKLIDVRTLSEYEADHAPMAVHIPVDELPNRYQELGQTTHLIAVCQAGGRSAAAAEFLTSIGCSEVYNVVGGMSSWSGPRVTGGQAQ